MIHQLYWAMLCCDGGKGHFVILWLLISMAVVTVSFICVFCCNSFTLFRIPYLFCLAVLKLFWFSRVSFLLFVSLIHFGLMGFVSFCCRSWVCLEVDWSFIVPRVAVSLLLCYNLRCGLVTLMGVAFLCPVSVVVLARSSCIYILHSCLFDLFILLIVFCFRWLMSLLYSSWAFNDQIILLCLCPCLFKCYVHVCPYLGCFTL